jgi:hypothetical protein
VPENLLAFAVKESARRDGSDAFGALRDVLGAQPICGPIELGAAWAALPMTYAIPSESWEQDWRPAIHLDVRPKGRRVGGRLLGVGANPLLSFDDVWTDLRRTYPTLPDGTRGSMLESSRALGAGHWMADIEWAPEDAPLEEVAETGESGHPWLMPVLPPGTSSQPRLVLWWVLLFGLSLIARYEPDAWATALDIQRSRLAVPLESVLELAENAVPQLLHHEVFR